MNYLIPANTKKGQLMLGLFRKFDLALFIIGVVITVALLAAMPISSTFVTILVLSPAGICILLVTPIPNYHNVLNVLTRFYMYLTNVQQYKWKGWCYKEWQKK